MTIFLVRHGSAGVRRDGDPTDTERHLDTDGLRQAEQVAEILQSEAADPPISVIVSSPAARCVETVAPLAVALGIDVEVDPVLFESTDIGSSWKVASGLAERGLSAVLCSHGDVIPDIVRRAKGRGMETVGRSGCSKGSIWRLEWDGERFATGSYRPNH